MSRRACAYAHRPAVRLTVYLRGNRVLSAVYPRLGAALRLRFSRKLDDFLGYKTEVLR